MFSTSRAPLDADKKALVAMMIRDNSRETQDERSSTTVSSIRENELWAISQCVNEEDGSYKECLSEEKQDVEMDFSKPLEGRNGGGTVFTEKEVMSYYWPDPLDSWHMKCRKILRRLEVGLEGCCIKFLCGVICLGTKANINTLKTTLVNCQNKNKKTTRIETAKDS